jgi:predicted secreted hydrolase
MPTTGDVRIGGERVPVTGSSWMDHEFGTSFLEASQVGWDWFSLQLDDGTDVMVYQIRTRDGRAHPSSSGTVVGPSGDTRRLRADDYALMPGRAWASPTSGARYPVAWTVSVPGLGLELQVSAVVDAQELHTPASTGVTYWEGAILVEGRRDGESIAGRGYLEMTGYVGRPMSEVLR